MLCCLACFFVAAVEKNEDEAEAEQEDKPVEKEENGEPQEEVWNSLWLWE